MYYRPVATTFAAWPAAPICLEMPESHLMEGTLREKLNVHIFLAVKYISWTRHTKGRVGYKERCFHCCRVESSPRHADFLVLVNPLRNAHISNDDNSIFLQKYH